MTLFRNIFEKPDKEIIKNLFKACSYSKSFNIFRTLLQLQQACYNYDNLFFRCHCILKCITLQAFNESSESCGYLVLMDSVFVTSYQLGHFFFSWVQTFTPWVKFCFLVDQILFLVGQFFSHGSELFLVGGICFTFFSWV